MEFNDLADFKKGPFGNALKKEIFVPKSNNVIKVYEQQNAINKDWKLERYFITKTYYEKMKSFTVYPGDIIVSCAGTIGQIYVLPPNADIGIINQALMLIRPSGSIIRKDYFIYIFEKMIDTFTLKFSNGSAIKNIPPFADLKKHKAWIPSLHEQDKIVKLISKIDNRIQTQNKTIKAIESQIFVINHIMICNSTETIKFKNLCTLENKTVRKSGDGIKDGIYPFFTNEENQTQYLNDYDFDGEYIIANTGGRANFKYYNGKFAVMSDSLVIKIKNPKYTTFYNNVLRDKQAYINHVGFEGSGLKHLNKYWLLNLQVPVFNEHTKKYLFVVEELKNKLIKEKDILSLYKKQKAYLLQNMFI